MGMHRDVMIDVVTFSLPIHGPLENPKSRASVTVTQQREMSLRRTEMEW
jgi:hypothetical protein